MGPKCPSCGRESEHEFCPYCVVAMVKQPGAAKDESLMSSRDLLAVIFLAAGFIGVVLLIAAYPFVFWLVSGMPD